MASRRGGRAEADGDHGMEMATNSIPGGLDEVPKHKMRLGHQLEFQDKVGPTQFRIRREQTGTETLRILAQMFFVGVTLFLIACTLMAPLNDTSPVRMPGMMFEATFGPVERLRHFDPPLMNRTRYESPGNFWRPFMFKPDTFLGKAQDSAYGLWNWGVRCIYLGPVHMKAFALLVTALIWAPLAAFGISLMQVVPEYLPYQIRMYYLRWMPEGLLILEQIMAAKRYGRKLSEKAELEVADDDLHAIGRLL